ncbi:MAG: Oligopeptide-binding protein OppA [Candidatus Anoxychlamydiales bacterium]|nr:Oligopeptide-binding protein OppA [Candidatus Anoxychlamydiales bacterium]NGX35840.1 Oligopeptide-binding protein OppA [Candidatus Anoxychlamydiales bacterium]
MKRLCLLILLIIFVCTKVDAKEANLNQKTLRTCIYSDPTSLDTRKASDYISSQILFMLFRGLMHYDSNGDLICSLAKSYTVSKDQKKYTFYLKDVYWSDGKAITAYDFEKSWKKILDPKFPSPYAELLYPIKNAEMAKKGLLDLKEVKIKAKDKKTLIVELEYPNPYFLFLTSFYTFFPMPSHQSEKDMLNDNIITSGPFKLKRWQRNNRLVLEKNPFFYNKDKINIDSFEINIIANEETAFQMYENGEVDFISSFLSPLSAETLGKISKREDANIVPIGGFSFLSFNVEKFPFNNRNLRYAFSLAIDRQKIVDNITQLKEKIAKRIIPPIFLKDENKVLIENNKLDLAKKLFDKALTELNVLKDDLKISFTFGSYIIHKKEAEALKQMWEKAFNISIKLNLLEDKTLLSKLHQRDYQIGLARLMVRYNDPLNIFERFKYKNHPKNYANWENIEFIKTLDLAKKEFDLKKRFDLILKAEKILVKDLAIAPLYFYNYTMLKKSYVKGIYSNIVGDLLFDETNVN